MKEHVAYVKEKVRRGRPPGLVCLRILYRGQVGTWFPLLFIGPDDLLRLADAARWDVTKVLLDRTAAVFYAFVAERA